MFRDIILIGSLCFISSKIFEILNKREFSSMFNFIGLVSCGTIFFKNFKIMCNSFSESGFIKFIDWIINLF